MQFRDLGAQYQALKQEIDEGIQAVINSTAFINGKPVTELENKLAEYVGRKHCVACGNGTDALQLALMIWGVGPGDAVFTSDFTYFASAGSSTCSHLATLCPLFTSLTMYWSTEWNGTPHIGALSSRPQLRPVKVSSSSLDARMASSKNIS